MLNFPYGEIRSIIIKVQHNCTSDRKSYGKPEDPPIKHEYCVVFKKTADDRMEMKRQEDATASSRPDPSWRLCPDREVMAEG